MPKHVHISNGQIQCLHFVKLRLWLMHRASTNTGWLLPQIVMFTALLSRTQSCADVTNPHCELLSFVASQQGLASDAVVS